MKKLWLSWYSLLLVCAILGFLPEPIGFWKVFCVVIGIASFVPAGLLLKAAADRQDKSTLRRVRNISIVSLSLTVVLYALNVLSVLLSEVWGNVFYVLLVLGSTPMICMQIWVLSLFGWAILLWTSITLLKSDTAN